MESRKQKEKEFHDRRTVARESNDPIYGHLTSNKKFYSVTRKSKLYMREWTDARCRGKRVLDYCCGTGGVACSIAERGALTVGIDISGASVEAARRSSISEGVDLHVDFFSMDAERLGFRDRSFDIITCSGVLHHLELERAYSELSRVLKHDGEIICVEALAHNPIISLYRRRTPHLRTEWETGHILGRRSLELAKRYFGKVEARFFHLASLGAMPFRNTPAFRPTLSLLEAADSILLRLPILKWQAWQVVFTLSRPRNDCRQDGGNGT